MKKIIIAVTILVASLSFTGCGKENAASKVKKENISIAEKRDKQIGLGLPEIKFDKEVHDFGTVNEGDIVEATFIVTNTGKSDLIILDAKATCGCTVPTWPKKPFSSGESKEITIKFNTSNKPNKQSKSVTLTTNTEKGNERISISGMVVPKNKIKK